MRLDLVFIYLVNRFWYRLTGFFVHWYGHTFLIFRRLIKNWGYGAAVVLAPAYVVWALIPVYLIARIFYGNLF